jgi:hypothetical protein
VMRLGVKHTVAERRGFDVLLHTKNVNGGLR